MIARQAGFSLVELMVTLAVMAVLAAAGTPFALSWIDSNRQMQARNLMWEAVSQVRAQALRNSGQVVLGQAAAQLQLSGNTLQVVRAGSNDVVWTGDLPSGARAKMVSASGDAGDTLSCVAFSNRGLRLPAASGCTTGAEQSRIAIGLGNQDPLHVDLL